MEERKMRKLMNKIVDCLCGIVDNPNVYSRDLADDVNQLARMVDEMEYEDEKKEEG